MTERFSVRALEILSSPKILMDYEDDDGGQEEIACEDDDFDSLDDYREKYCY